MKKAVQNMTVMTCLILYSMMITAQNKYNVEADIERAVKEFFYKVSEMNNPVEPIRPENIASAYQKGINAFQFNNVNFKLLDFLNWYKKYVLEKYSISHQIQITSIKPLQEKNRFEVKGILHRKIEDDTQRRRIRDEAILIKVIWRGQEYNNVSFQSLSFKYQPNFLKPNIIKEYELSVDPIVSHLPSEGGNWTFELISDIKSMEGFDGEARTCVERQPIGGSYYNVDDIDIKIDNRTFSGYIDRNKSKTARCFLINVYQKESNKMVRHYIYQEGNKQIHKK